MTSKICGHEIESVVDINSLDGLQSPVQFFQEFFAAKKSFEETK